MSPRARGRTVLLWAPLAIFLILFGLAAAGLFRPAERTVPSRLVGKPMPAMSLPAILPNHPGFESGQAGPRLVNIFASWCGPCEAEVAQLAVLKSRGVAIDGIAIRDTPAALADFLARNGDPYRVIGSDPTSRSMMALGSSGVPESFVVDGRGIIRYHHVGAIGAQDIDDITRAYAAAR